jgi:AcrR family transcriptional regulator
LTTRRKTPVQTRSRATLDQILEAASALLVEEGYEATSTNRIARRAGLSVGSFYQYFPSKEAVVAELIDRQADAMLGVLMGRLAELAGETFEQSVRTLVRTIFELFSQNAALNKVLLEQLHRVGRLDRLRELETRAVQVVQLYLGMQRQRVRPQDLEMASLILVHLVDSLAIVFTVYYPDRLANERLGAEVAELVLRYVLSDRIGGSVRSL